MATKEITEHSKAESNETGEEITDLESDIQQSWIIIQNRWMN